MILHLNEIKLTLEEDKSKLKSKIAKKLKIKETQIKSYRIVKESIDARKQLQLSYSVDVELTHRIESLQAYEVDIHTMQYQYPKMGNKKQKGRIVVVGFGPAGMFAALLLAEMGYQPLVIERGDCMEERVQKVQRFFHEGILDVNSNVQFGEGGAGTFSDGKLTTRSKDYRCHKVLEEFVKYGAPSEIMYQAYPHIGTDIIQKIVVKIRQAILNHGGEIRFLHQLQDFKAQDHTITQVKMNDEWIDCKALLLAVGHSARDTFVMLAQKKVEMQAKSFAVGVRIEHPQSFIDQSQYKEYANHPKLKKASYRLTHTTKKGRGVYTFCMCPGGVVVGSASQKGGVVVNGMSEYARDKENANSAILVQVHPEDCGHELLDGMYFQEALEQKAFLMGNESYCAPAQKVKDYLQYECENEDDVKATYQPGIVYCDLHDLFPEFINEALEEGLYAFDKKIKGFVSKHDAIMTAVESRSSSPVRILRDKETLESLSFQNFYPCGEGAGYAGGIVSAAIDGLKVAEKIIEKFAPENKLK